MQPLFLTVDEILAIHADQIERYGGDGSLRDAGLLQSAAAMPHAGSSEGYLHPTLFDMAAAYLYHLTQNHPFVDGNKRTAGVAAIVFLDLNGVELDCDEESFEALVRDASCGQTEKAQIADFLRLHSRPTT